MRKYLKQSLPIRFILSILIAFVFGYLISETAYLILGEDIRRPPDRIEIFIPSGTAERVAKGESIPTIPQTMVFVEGDELAVINHDDVSHQIGPIWVPPGATGTMLLDKPKSFSLACSFQPENYFGLDVRERVTFWLRIQGVLAIGAPSGVLLGLYSLLVIPLQKETVS